MALVSGGSKALGRAMAQGFAEAGADVVIARSSGDNWGRLGPPTKSTRRAPQSATSQYPSLYLSRALPMTISLLSFGNPPRG